jgi:hypothetical protein
MIRKIARSIFFTIAVSGLLVAWQCSFKSNRVQLLTSRAEASEPALGPNKYDQVKQLFRGLRRAEHFHKSLSRVIQRLLRFRKELDDRQSPLRQYLDEDGAVQSLSDEEVVSPRLSVSDHHQSLTCALFNSEERDHFESLSPSHQKCWIRLPRRALGIRYLWKGLDSTSVQANGTIREWWKLRGVP